MIPFFAEELSNINTLRACISVEPNCDVARTLQVKDSQLRLNDTVVAELSQVNTSVSTANLVVAQPMTTTATDALIPWEIKLSLIDSQKRSQQTELKERWPAKVVEETEHIVCQQCAQPLIEQANYQFKDLPSEHWYELVECWICHETKPEEHKSRMRPILARPDTVLVGTTYLLLHAQNIQRAAIQPNQALFERQDWTRGTFTKWITIDCTKCGHVIGEGQFNQGSEMLAAKLFKYSVSLLPPIQDQPVFIDFLMSDLVNAAKIHATHKFLIQGRQTNQVYCLLWLFNWDTHILFNGGYNQTDQAIERKRVAKVMYLDCTQQTEQVQTHLSLWSKDKSTDHLIYPDLFCQQLMETLAQSNLILPPFMRQIDHPAMVFTRCFSVGFLPKA